MSLGKQRLKALRKQFNEECLKRDKNKCVFCPKTENLNVHHITDRHEIPNDGYVKENGITVCEQHHWDCEQYHIGKLYSKDFHPNELYLKIGSSKEEAFEKSKQLK